MKRTTQIKRMAVLGAGVMGTQIAALGANCGIETRLYDLSPDPQKPNALVERSIAQLTQPLERSDLLLARNYRQHLTELLECDLIIEAIAERIDWKQVLYAQIQPYLNDNTILATNTSGLSIEAMAHFLPEKRRAQFCGMHFFNPPRVMRLVELIPSSYTASDLIAALTNWLTHDLGKGVVLARDTPNFIANRIGVFALLVAIHYADYFQLACDEVDALTGLLIERPSSATFRTMDVVGLDTMQHVVNTMHVHLTDDPWHGLFQLPDWMISCIKDGRIGQKSGCGVYRKREQIIEVFDRHQQTYRLSSGQVHTEVMAMMQLAPIDRFHALATATHPQAQFLWACFRELFYYSAFHFKAIAHDVRDVDHAMRWGFGWQKGPFELWSDAGVASVLNRLTEDLRSQKSFAQIKLPKWLNGVETFG